MGLIDTHMHLESFARRGLLAGDAGNFLVASAIGTVAAHTNLVVQGLSVRKASGVNGCNNLFAHSAPTTEVKPLRLMAQFPRH